MSLKLFRSTEFAQSRNFSPGVQRRSLQPLWLVLAAGCWIAGPGNWALWAALTRTPGIDTGATLWIGLRIALLIAVASSGLLCLFMWRWTTKPVVSLALIATALASLSAAAVPSLLSWQAGLYLLVVALVPCVWLWRTQFQRLSLRRNLRQVVMAGTAFVLTFGLLLAFSFKDLAALQAKEPTLRAMVSPYSHAGATAALEKILLRRKP